MEAYKAPSLDSKEQVDALVGQVQVFLDKLCDATHASGLPVSSFTLSIPNVGKALENGFCGALLGLPCVICVSFDSEWRLTLSVDMELHDVDVEVTPPPLPTNTGEEKEQSRAAVEQFKAVTKNYINEMAELVCKRFNVPPAKPTSQEPPGGVSLMTDEPRQTMKEFVREVSERLGTPALDTTSVSAGEFGIKGDYTDADLITTGQSKYGILVEPPQYTTTHDLPRYMNLIGESTPINEDLD
jgi:hypothetical protein